MKKERVLVFLLLLADLAVFFTMQDKFDENSRWALVGGALILAIIWVYLGETPKSKKPRAVARKLQAQGESNTDSESNIDIPEVITKDDMDGASLRERKMAKVMASQSEEEENMVSIEPDDSLEEVTVSVEEVHVADEFVVEVSPQ
jgi:hypothetical protein